MKNQILPQVFCIICCFLFVSNTASPSSNNQESAIQETAEHQNGFSNSNSSPTKNSTSPKLKTVTRNRRSDLHSIYNKHLNEKDGNAAFNSAFRYNDQIMRNLLKTHSPSYSRSHFFLNLLRPLDRRTTRFNSWDDHSVMHFGKRSAPENIEENLPDAQLPTFNQEESDAISTENSISKLENDFNFDQKSAEEDKRSQEPWHSMMSFGKKSENAWDNHNTMHFGKKDDPWHNMMSFGKKSEEDSYVPNNGTQFEKRDDPWHNMMSFGKKSENLWNDHNTMHFGKRDDPWHNMMSFGKKSEDFWNDHNTMHFGKRDDPWHNMMSFGKKSEDPWNDHNTMHFGKRDDPWHNMMSFGKKSEDPWNDHNTMHFGKRDDPWHNMMSFGKKSEDPWNNHNTMHFGKREDPWHNMMSFGKKSEDFWNDHNTMHFGKRDEPWHNMMSFGKKSEDLWNDHNTMHFGKRDDPWHNMMSFGKKSEDFWNDHNTMHFGKKSEPWHDMMSFGKKSENIWNDHNTLHFGKRDEPWHNMMSFGKKSEDFLNDHNTMHFGKRNEPWHNMMSFGKKSENFLNALPKQEITEINQNDVDLKENPENSLYDLNMQHSEDKKNDPWHNMMSFGKKSENSWNVHNTMHFGKRYSNEPWHNAMNFGKRTDDAWHNMMSFGKKAENPFNEHSTMHFGKKDFLNPKLTNLEDNFISDINSAHLENKINDSSDFLKRSDVGWGNHNTMHFGKRDKDEIWHSMMSFGKKYDHSFNTPNIMHFGKKSNDYEYKTTNAKDNEDLNVPEKLDGNTNLLNDDIKAFNKRSVHQISNKNDFELQNKLNEDNNRNENSMAHFEKKTNPWDSHNTMHFGKKSDSWNSHNTMHFGKKSVIENNNNLKNFENMFDSKNENIHRNSNQNQLKIKLDIPNRENVHIPVFKPQSVAILKDKNVRLDKRSLTNNVNPSNLQNLEHITIKKANHSDTSEYNKGENLNSDVDKSSSLSQDVKGKSDNLETKLQVTKRSIKSLPDSDESDQNYEENTEEGTDNNVLHFGKRSLDNERDYDKIFRKPWENQSTLNLDKRTSPWESHNTMHFGKRFDSHGVMHFGKKWDFSDFYNNMNNNKKYDAWQAHNTMHFGKKQDPWSSHNTMHFGKKSNPWESHNTLHFGKRSHPGWDQHGVMHFGKREKEEVNKDSESESYENFENIIANLLEREHALSELNAKLLANKEELDPYVNNLDNILSDEEYNKLMKLKLEQQLENEVDSRLSGNEMYQIPESIGDIPKEIFYMDGEMKSGGNDYREQSPEEKKILLLKTPAVDENYFEIKQTLEKAPTKRYLAPFQGPKSIVYPPAWLISQIRRARLPNRQYETRVAEKKEDPVNSFMHFGRR